MKVLSSWSGGKDSCFALFKAIQMGYEVAYLVNSISDDHQRVRFHGLPAEVIKLQSEATEIPLLQKETSADHYRRDYLSNVKRGLKQGVSGIVFGDIFLEDCYLWAEDLCNELNVTLVEPLWKIPSEKVLEEFIESGFEAIVVSTQSDLLGKEWVGRTLDRSFLADISKLKDTDPCGENGEYHTLVVNGPLFKKKIIILEAKKVYREGYWFYSIEKSQLV